MTIHTFGDSHTRTDNVAGWQYCGDVVSHWLGATLCYSFGRDKLERCDISKKEYNVKQGDTVVFSFGEIDCRCHIHKYITQDKTYQMIINEIIDNYEKAIKINIDNCKVDLKNVCIYNVVPTVQKYNTFENPEYPYLGTDEERKNYVLYFNECLKEKCQKNNWIFIDIYKYYADNNGFLNKFLSDGNVHIRDGTYLKEFVNTYL